MENLLERLDEAFQSDDVDKKEVIKGILWDYQQSGDTDWKKYVFWNPIKYSRNLVEITPAYEIIVLCWTEDQESPIHNHSGQDCWFIVLDGTVEEVPYLDTEMGLVSQQPSTYTAGAASWISDSLWLHKVRPVNGRAITLHVYSKPIPSCNIYCPITGMVQRRKSGFYTVRGKKVGANCNCYRYIISFVLKGNVGGGVGYCDYFF
eukprot:TRINITY_DN3590_c0_g1_i10.p1 TRINITY_DN3590_c0_g1~~TRINITY_DN3590_c0_g1_i10.p1  ORF type:complete len:205 (+),score=19.16 TRINITY_DN3590_c0_g1_i10:119-733(+)